MPGSPPVSTSTDAVPEKTEPMPVETSPAPRTTNGTAKNKRSHFDQPTCAICLDDFAAGESMVRQLPCEHIFHPECVDAFLRDNSSLCPLCKKSALPKGYCPTVVTNAMVRRERNIRRSRPSAQGNNAGSRENRASRILGRLGRRSNATDVEMAATIPSAPSPVHVQSNAPDAVNDAPPAQPAGRREWARRRALSMLGPRPAPTEAEAHNRPQPRWRKWFRSVYPS